MMKKALWLIIFCSLLTSPSFSSEQQIKCLADNIYWAARNQEVRGMMAVAHVTRNRVRSPHWPSTYCEVIEEGPMRESWTTRKNPLLPEDQRVYFPKRDRCQFSWYCDGKSDSIPSQDTDIYEVARMIAFKIVHNWFDDNTFGATHYHADYVSPNWANEMTHTVTIGTHIFYKYP